MLIAYKKKMERFSCNHELQSTRETKIKGGEKIAVEKRQTEGHKRSEIGDVRDVAARVSFELATIRFQPNCTDWPSLKGCLPLCYPSASARTHAHTFIAGSLLNTCPTWKRGTDILFGHGTGRQEAIPWSLRTVLLYGFHRFVSIMIVWKDECVIWPRLTRPIAAFIPLRRGLGVKE